MIAEHEHEEPYLAICSALVAAGIASSNALAHYGSVAQRLKCIEEMGEAIAELARNENPETTMGELADVMVTMLAVVQDMGVQRFADVLSGKAGALRSRLAYEEPAPYARCISWE